MTVNASKRTQTRLYDKCERYLFDNFSKFKKADKIKVALAIYKAHTPQQLEHSGGMELNGEVKITDKYQEFLETNLCTNIGTSKKRF